jgi:hypothetical protein
MTSQRLLLLAVQAQSDGAVTVTVPIPPARPNEALVAEREKLHAGAP